MGESLAGRERLTAAERKQRAVELRKLGFSFQKIADQMGISQSGAHKMVVSALQELNERTVEGAEELRRLELERLDEWLLRIAQEIKNGNVLGAIDRGIRIMDRRAKLLGLDAPQRAEIAGPDGGPIEVADARERLLEMIERRARAKETEASLQSSHRLPQQTG